MIRSGQNNAVYQIRRNDQSSESDQLADHEFFDDQIRMAKTQKSLDYES